MRRKSLDPENPVTYCSTYIYSNVIRIVFPPQSKPVVEMPAPIEKVPVMPVLGTVVLNGQYD